MDCDVKIMEIHLLSRFGIMAALNPWLGIENIGRSAHVHALDLAWLQLVQFTPNLRCHAWMHVHLQKSSDIRFLVLGQDKLVPLHENEQASVPDHWETAFICFESEEMLHQLLNDLHRKIVLLVHERS